MYETDPVGVVEQPAFLNLVIEAETTLSPAALLQLIQGIEHAVGRIPTYRWGPRRIDIDIVLYGARVIEEEQLIIPHVEMTRRAFVLVPLAEIAPTAVHPGTGMTAQELLASLDISGVRVAEGTEREAEALDPEVPVR